MSASNLRRALQALRIAQDAVLDARTSLPIKQVLHGQVIEEDLIAIEGAIASIKHEIENQMIEAGLLTKENK